MEELIGYYKKVDVTREYGSLVVYLQEKVIKVTEANYIVRLIGNVVFVYKFNYNEDEETLIACASNFAFTTDSIYNF